MILVKPGNKKFVYACKEKFFEVTCNYCGAVMEMQEGELLSHRHNYKDPVTYRFKCPYCDRYHSDYTTRYLRTETMNLKDVMYPDSIRNPQWETTEDELEKTMKQEFDERLGVTTKENGSRPSPDATWL